MQVITRVDALRDCLARAENTSFVPTMGNLHAGHVALVEEARRHGRPVVASIFVNPMQFGPSEDLDAYPRSIDADCEKLAAAGADYAFVPATLEMYPVEQTCRVAPPALANDLCGAHRPGHFEGVCTAVFKLFNIVGPRVALFGKKDYQQLWLIRDMVRQFNLPIAIVACETVRAADGLALSSRNGYLSSAERAEAPRLVATLGTIRDALDGGERHFDALEALAARTLLDAGWRVDYVAIRDADTLTTPAPDTRRFVVLAAAWLGRTRLIDNLEAGLG
jgi:pantoate--beta-alanine ligase